MPSSVSSISKSNPSTKAPSPPIASKPAPLGISAAKNTIQSAKTKEEGFTKTIIQSIKNILKAILDSIKDVFLCIFPFKSIFLKKQVVSLTEQKYCDYQRKLYRVDSLSPTLAQKEAKELLPHFNAFEKVGEIKIKKRSISLSFFTKREDPSTQEIVKIGKDVAKKDHLKLIAVLKEYYIDQVSKLEIELKKEKKSN